MNYSQDSIFEIVEELDSAAFRLVFLATDPDFDTLSYNISWDGGDWFSEENYLVNQSLMDFSDTTFNIHVEISDREFQLTQDIQIKFMVEQILSVVGYQEIYLYPNPVDEFFLLRGMTRFSYVIYSLDGKEITRGNYNGKEPIEVRQLPPGNYLLEVLEGNEYMNFRFIKN